MSSPKVATFHRVVTISNLPMILHNHTIMVQIKGRNGGELDATTEGYVPDNSQKNSERNLNNSSLLTT